MFLDVRLVIYISINIFLVVFCFCFFFNIVTGFAVSELNQIYEILPWDDLSMTQVLVRPMGNLTKTD